MAGSDLPPILPADWDLPLALGYLFERSEDDLERLVLRSTGQGLYLAWVPRGLTLLDRLEKLLSALEEHNEKVPFLRVVLQARPGAAGLRALVAAVCPQALVGLPEVGAQVATVVQGIDDLRSKLGDSEVTSAVQAARSGLEQVAQRIEQLAAYKILHDGLHKLQLQLSALTREAARLLTAPESWVQVEAGRAAIEMMRPDGERAVGLLKILPAGTPANTPGDRVREEALLKRIGGIGTKLGSAIETSDVVAAQGAVQELRRLIRIEPVRLELLMFRIAGTLPLKQLVDTLEMVALELDRTGKVPPSTLNQMLKHLEVLRSGLGWQVEVHRLWQEAETKLWAAEELLGNNGEEVGDEARDEFGVHWDWAREKHSEARRRDPAAPWAAKLEALATSVDQRPPSWAPEQLRPSFFVYRIRALGRFYEVDAMLRVHCEAILEISRPLRGLLDRAG